MKLRLYTHIECIYFCKWIAVGLLIAFTAGFTLESNIELKIIINQGLKFFLAKRSKILFDKVLCACKLSQTHNQGGRKPSICIGAEVFRHHFRFYKKVYVDLRF